VALVRLRPQQTMATEVVDMMNPYMAPELMSWWGITSPLFSVALAALVVVIVMWYARADRPQDDDLTDG
jgi:hypothetical protein